MASALRPAAAGAVLALWLALGPVPGEAQQLAGTLKKVKDTGAIVLGYREASPPFSFLPASADPAAAAACEEAAPGGDAGRPRSCALGYSIDLCREIVEEVSAELDGMPVRVRFRPVTPETRIPAVKGGEVDLECGSTTNDHVRRRDVAFSPPFFITGTRLLVRKADGVASFQDLKGRTVVVTAGTTNEGVIRELDRKQGLGLRVVTAPDHAASFAMVTARQADAFATDDILLYGLVAEHRAEGELAVVGDMLSYDPYGIMYRRDDPGMAEVVDRAFGRLASSGEIVGLYDRWLLRPLPDGAAIGRPMSPQLMEILHTLGLPD